MILTVTLTVLLGNYLISAEHPYYGKLIQNGWGAAATHGLAGSIYAIDENSFQVIGFSFDGTGDAAFLLGNSGSYNDAGQISVVTIMNPAGQADSLRSYSSEDVVLFLPSNTVLTDYKYIAVGNSATKEIYGGANIPAGFTPPAPVAIGVFSQLAHQVRSGTVTVLNDRTIKIEAFNYDGSGPDAFFYVGVTNDVGLQSSPYGKIPDENGVIGRKALRYRNKDIMLTLPDTISATDLKWLSMFCITYTHDFGHVTFPDNLNVPPYTEIAMMPEQSQDMNCEPLSDDLQVSWAFTEDSIMIELAGRIDRSKEYMAFGLSGSSSSFAMVGSDVVVVDYRENAMPRAIDYYITDYAQCSTNGGVCPDTSAFLSATNDVTMAEGEVRNGVTRVSYTRALNTGDVGSGKDQEYKTDGTLQQIVWAIGPLNTNNEAAKHTSRIEVAKAMNFGRTVADNCPIFEPKNKVELPKFSAHHICGKEGTVFTAEIGASASEQGYAAITGLPTWGIAWYINGILIPELHLKRGVSYTFRVAGGTDSAVGSMYHPLYFTDSEEGGYEQTNNGTIYPGTVNGVQQSYAVGDYCEWKLNLTLPERVHNTFEQLKEDLYLDCVPGNQTYTEFVFTPTAAMPDTIYYQCYSHKTLGWKMNLYNVLPTAHCDPTTAAGTTVGATATTSTATGMTTMASTTSGTNSDKELQVASKSHSIQFSYCLFILLTCLSVTSFLGLI